MTDHKEEKGPGSLPEEKRPIDREMQDQEVPEPNRSLLNLKEELTHAKGDERVRIQERIEQLEKEQSD